MELGWFNSLILCYLPEPWFSHVETKGSQCPFACLYRASSHPNLPSNDILTNIRPQIESFNSVQKLNPKEVKGSLVSDISPIFSRRRKKQGSPKIWPHESWKHCQNEGIQLSSLEKRKQFPPSTPPGYLFAANESSTCSVLLAVECFRSVCFIVVPTQSSLLDFLTKLIKSQHILCAMSCQLIL